LARIAGVNLPVNKRALVSLDLYSWYWSKICSDILKANDLDHTKRIKDFTEDEISKIRKSIDESYTVEGDLRRNVSQNIKRLKDLRLLSWFKTS
jgi:small subunit ribosomal protein S13